MFCKECGKKISDSATTCPKCGASQVGNKQSIEPKSKTTAVLLAVFLGLWTWVYTYDRDKAKFWICLGISLVTFGLFAIVAWIWAIIDTCNKSQDWYAKF